jgi:homocysteine S-methyltransferase
MEPYLSRLKKGPLVFDGAMGTMVYGKGVFINTCFEELSLTRPALIEEIHREYIAAGADAIESNTFGANRIKLKGYGLADKVREINQVAVKLARSNARDEIYVAGSVGPLGHDLAPLGLISLTEARAAFTEQISALVDAGVDLILLETFRSLDELKLAIDVCRAFPGIPLEAHFTVTEDGEGFFGNTAAYTVSELDKDDRVQVIGLNCGIGPSVLLSVLEKVRSFTAKPLAVMPNAGLPQEVDGRSIYMSTPEYMAEYAKRMVDLGAAVIGGCCGTTPAHIREIAGAIHAVHRPKINVSIKTYAPDAAVPPVAVVPLEQKSLLGGKLARREFLSLLELSPPRGCSLTATVQKARLCKEHGIDVINIPDGPRASARLSNLMMALEIQRQAGIEPLPHYCCRDRNIIGMQGDLLGAYAAGIRNVLIITGDPPKLGDYPDATAVFDVDAIGLTKIAYNLNHGRDLAGVPFSPPTGFCLGVGLNPVAMDPQRELERYRAKVNSGAEYAITQPVFEVRALEEFLDKIKDCAIPVIAGIWPLVSYKNAEFLKNEVPGVSIPDSIMARMAKTDTKENSRLEGIAIAREIIEKIRPRLAGIQVSAPFGQVETAFAVFGK